MDNTHENSSLAADTAYCSQCGHLVSRGDKFCPACGYSLETKTEYAGFCLKREKKTYFCAAVNDVYLDYQMVCQLKNGERYNATIPLGEHHLELIDKKNFNKSIYSERFTIDKAGLLMTYSASLKVNDMREEPLPSGYQVEQPATPVLSPSALEQNDVHTKASMSARSGRKCPKCGGTMTFQVVAEHKKAGCGTILFYILLSITILGLLVVIPLLLRNKTNNKTYAVCQSCGYRQKA